MEAKEEFEVDHLNTPTGTSFSQLLFGDDDEDENPLGFGVDQTYNLSHSPVFPIHKAPKMLCFGNYQNEGDLLFPETNVTPQKSVITSSDSSSASSCNHSSTSFNSLSKPNVCDSRNFLGFLVSNWRMSLVVMLTSFFILSLSFWLKSLQKKRNGSGQEPVTKAGVGGQRPPKKTKAENSTSTGHAKRKEKLGERIAALQQLVSPFGKTDTASVLHEAMGYIKFLHDQVQVLCSPYLVQRLPSSQHQLQHQPGDGDNNEEEVNKDLRSRGLCLIPVGCTVHVASSNGADFWSPAAIGDNVSASSKQ